MAREWETRVKNLRDRIATKVVKPAPPAPAAKARKVETKAAPEDK